MQRSPQETRFSPAGSVGASAYFVCRGLHRRPAPLDTLRVPRFHFLYIQKTANTAKAVLAVLAGAEGLEPSALGFGDRYTNKNNPFNKANFSKKMILPLYLPLHFLIDCNKYQCYNRFIK